MAVRIGVGLAGFPFADAARFWEWIELLEESGFDSFWQTDRLVSRDPQLESISTMAALAGATSRLKFGMSVTVVTFRDPLVLAKQCATIDFLSNGRLLPAFGVGPAVAPELSPETASRVSLPRPFGSFPVAWCRKTGWTMAPRT